MIKVIIEDESSILVNDAVRAFQSDRDNIIIGNSPSGRMHYLTKTSSDKHIHTTNGGKLFMWVSLEPLTILAGVSKNAAGDLWKTELAAITDVMELGWHVHFTNRKEWERRDAMAKMPQFLCSGNGAKALLSGEFHESIEIDEDEEGRTSTHKVTVSWTTIKDMYEMIVKYYTK